MMAGKRRGVAAAAGVRWFGPDGHGQQGGQGGGIGGPTSAPRQGEEGVVKGHGGNERVGMSVTGDGGSGGDAVAGAGGSGQLAGEEETLDSGPRSERDVVFSGMQGRLERLEREFESLKDFVRTGQEEVGRDVEK